MARAPNVKSLIDEAEELERQYEWLKAAELYTKTVRLVPSHDYSLMGEFYERLGLCSFKAAFQGENSDTFRARCTKAVESYEKSRGCYAKSSDAHDKPRESRCDAMIAFVHYWLASEVTEKKRKLDECWEQTKLSLNGFAQNDDALRYGKTINQLSTGIDVGFYLQYDSKSRERRIKETVEYGEKAIRLLTNHENSYELARAYSRTSTYLKLLVVTLPKVDNPESYLLKAKEYAEKAKQLSGMAALLESLTVLERYGLDGGEGTNEALENFEKAFQHGKSANDRFITGSALDHLAYHMAWKASAVEDPEEYRGVLDRAYQYAKDAKTQFSPISFTTPGYGHFWSAAPDSEYYWLLSSLETDLDKRRKLLEKAMERSRDLMMQAKNSGYADTLGFAHHAIGKILLGLAAIERNAEQKKTLLEEALKHRKEVIVLYDRLKPGNCWDRGIMLSRLADVKYGLAALAKAVDTKKNLLQEAVSDRENSTRLLIKGLTIYGADTPLSLLSDLAGGQEQHGYWLARLYKLTGNKEWLKRAAEAFEEALKSVQKINMKSWIAECHWHLAQVYDDLGNYSKGAENFDNASRNYEMAAEKIPQLRDLFSDNAIYMQAWTEIEKARYHHEKQEYQPAKEHFGKAANLHMSSKNWSYMAPNYCAWTQVENAEDLSRKEQGEEAIQAFEKASELFAETKKSLQAQLSKIGDLDEEQMVTDMLKATDLRREYCRARVVVEEAKILDKKGEHFSSSEKYSLAAQILEKITNISGSEQEQRELKLLRILAQAWQKMTQAEAEVSPDLYVEASQLFEEAKNFSASEKTRLLILGHSRFCLALESGTRFADTRDMKMYDRAMNHLESAGNYYVKAGFQRASEYAKATRLLFEGYVHMDNAEKETDPERKARLCAMAEKILQTSAGAFMKAEHPEKREEVLALFETVKEERELATSLTEVLNAHSIVSTTTAFTAPTPISEEAVGSERLEHATIQANLIVGRKELKIGENLDVEVELVNAGKGPAVLIKITDGIPEGFELAQKPDPYRVENSHLNLKGKRLDPLKTEEVKFVLKPKVQGVFPLKPRIMYLDENGRYKSYETEPVNITVKELGIKGWLKGER